MFGTILRSSSQGAALRREGAPRKGRAWSFVEPRDSLELQLAVVYESVLGIAPVGVRDDFFELGGSSLQAVRLFERIEDVLGASIPASTLLAAPTVEALAARIRQAQWASPTTSLVAIQPHGTRVPFFCAHLAFGHVFYYRDLVRHLGPDQPFHAFQAVGMDGRAERHRRIEDMAAHYLAEMRALRPSGPYLLGGASFGGLVAYEMAQQLARDGEEPALVALFDTPAPVSPGQRREAPTLLRTIAHLARRIEHHVGSLYLLEPDRRTLYLRAKAANAAVELRELAGARFPGVLDAIGRPLPPDLEETKKTIQGTLARYVPSAYPGRLTLFRASKRALGATLDPTLGWGRLAAGGVEIHEVPGYHGAIVSEPRVRFLVEPLRACLTRATETR